MSRLITLVELRGFEPLTFSLRTRRATNCATAPCALEREEEVTTGAVVNPNRVRPAAGWDQAPAALRRDCAACSASADSWAAFWADSWASRASAVSVSS